MFAWGKVSEMMILLYFDWVGCSKELKEWETKIKEACVKTGVEYKGLYGSMNEKWNYVGIFETEAYGNFLAMGKNVVRHQKMPHNITEVLLPQIL
jgi:hypothetical protein